MDEWIRDNTKEKVGFSVSGVDVYVHRKYKIEDVSYDPETTCARIRGNIGYKTGPMAFIPISISGGFDVKYTVRTGDIDGAKIKLETSYGDIPIDFTPIKKVMEGDLAAALELIPNGGLVKRKTSSEYDERKKWFEEKYKKENVYFASSDFVRWASPETAGKWALELIGSGGTAASAIANEAQSQMRKELVHITTWLKTKISTGAEQFALDLVSGKPISLPELELRWQKVVYKSQANVAGQDLPEISVPHAAFVLIWKTTTSPPVDFDRAPQRQIADDNSPRPKWKIGARYALGPSGSRIVFMTPGGPAENAGLKIGDIILEADGSPVGVSDNTSDILSQMIKKSPDQSLSLKVLSGNTTSTVVVQLQPVF